MLVIQFLHFFDLVVVAPQYILVLLIQLLLNSISGLDALELVEQVESAFGGAKLVSEGVSNELDNVSFDSCNAGFELVKSGSPLEKNVVVVNVVFKARQLLDAFLKLVNARLDRLRGADNSFEVWAKDGVELL